MRPADKVSAKKEEEEEENKEKGLSPTRGEVVFFSFLYCLDQEGGGRQKICSKTSYFHGDFVFLILSFSPLFIP